MRAPSEVSGRLVEMRGLHVTASAGASLHGPPLRIVKVRKGLVGILLELLILRVS